MPLTISQAAERSGCSPPTIRYYESIGLVRTADRTASGRRTFGHPDVARLTFIRRSRDFGLSIEQVRELLTASTLPTDACAPARSIVAAHLKSIRTRRQELRELEVSLQSILARCQSNCTPTGSGGCTIFEDMTGSGSGGSHA